MGNRLDTFLKILALTVISGGLLSGSNFWNSSRQNESHGLAPEHGTETIQNNASIAIATTVLNPGDTLPDWLDYHLRWVQHVVIYMDDPNERPLFERLCGDRPVTLLEGSQVDPSMTPESRLIRRQMANMKHAIAYLLKRDYTWLLHMDLDELLNGPLVESRAWATDRQIGLVTFTNHEALPVDFETSEPFKDCIHFWVNGVDRNANFAAYGNGKSAVRLGPYVEPRGPHSFSGYAGRAFTLSGDQAMILHYPYPSYNSWFRKFDFYGRFPDNWFGDRHAPKIIDFMLQSRDVIQTAHKTNNWASAKTFFDRRVLDSKSREEAISQGRIRQYTPFANFLKDR
ncbi:hypothetical protein N7488_000744 [Penicillium malachiteum]|nr:hypothetical protein N7488_000744 [Penicillium malachiteum]